MPMAIHALVLSFPPGANRQLTFVSGRVDMCQRLDLLFTRNFGRPHRVQIAESPFRTIQTGANEVGEAMQTTGGEVTRAVSLSQQAGQAFEAITTGAQAIAAGVRSASQAVDVMRQTSQVVQVVMGNLRDEAERNRAGADAMDSLTVQAIESLDTVSAVVEENTAATEQMAAGSNEVTHAIENVASVSEENSAALFVANFQAMRARIEADGPSPALAIELQHKPADWLVNHIRKIDTHLGPCLTQKVVVARKGQKQGLTAAGR